MSLGREDRVIDSQWLAAFRLGYHGRLLRAVQDDAFVGDNEDEAAMGSQLRPLRDSAFVLLAGEDEGHRRAFAEVLADLSNLYGASVHAPAGAREFFANRQRHAWEKLDLLRRRAVGDGGPLAACFEVGHVLAELVDDVECERIGSPIDESGLEGLRKAVEGLPWEARRPAIALFPGPKDDLSFQVGELLDYRATLEQLVVRAAKIEVRVETGLSTASFPLKPYHEEVLAVLADRGRRMTTTQLLAALSDAGKEFSETTYKNAFSYLVRLGLVENCARCVPRGYSLPGWDHHHPNHPSR